MGNETSKAVYIAKKIEYQRKSKLKVQKKQQQLLENETLPNEKENDQVNQKDLMVQKLKSHFDQDMQSSLSNRQGEPRDNEKESYLKNENNQFNRNQMERQQQKAQNQMEAQQKAQISIRDPQNFQQGHKLQNRMQDQNENSQQNQLFLKHQQIQKDKPIKQFKWQNYGPSYIDIKTRKNSKIKNQIIQLSDDLDQVSNKDSQSLESSSPDIEQIINDALSGQSSQNEMIDETQQRTRPRRRRVKIEAQENQAQKKLKFQYNESKIQDLDVFVWSRQRDSIRQMELSEQSEILYRLQKELLKKASLEQIFPQTNIKQKFYLKSVDILAVDLNYEVFASVKELQQYQSDIRLTIMSNEDNDDLMMRQNILKTINSDNQHVLQGKIHPQCANLPAKNLIKQYWFTLILSDFKVGKSIFIENIDQRYNSWQRKFPQYFQSLKFLLSHGIIQIQTTKIMPSPYEDIDVQQIYLNTRKSLQPETIEILNKKKLAQFSVSFPLTFNLHNYYKYACQLKIEKTKNTEDQNVFSMKDYSPIFFQINDHLRNVINFTNKSKWDETLKNTLLEKWHVFLQKSSDQQQKNENEKQPQQEEIDYCFDEPKSSTLNKEKGINLPYKQISKQQLQQLFESGKWFSLDSKKVSPIQPSKYFNGQLKQYQKLTLAWMLYRENCPINYKLQRPQQHCLWSQIENIGQKLYMNKVTHQILNYLPIWRKNVNGGMLCDQMGLGKTVMTLALIDKHLSQRKYQNQRDENHAGTLIIVPTTVLLQWQAKINQFLPHLTYLIAYKGQHITKQKVLKSEIVLTTFGIVRAQQKKFSKTCQLINKDQSKCTIYDFKWMRVIVDEADNLRNFKTESAKGIQSIPRKFTWLLTGTPIQNKVTDLESYFNLLSYEQNWIVKASTKKGFIKDQKSLILLKQSLKDIMVRRKKDTLDQFGKPLLDLKQFKWINKNIDFTPQQQKFYDHISQKIVNQIQKILQQDKQNQQWDEKMPRLNKKIDTTSHQNIEHVFGKLMKLRQFCCHPALFNSKSTFIRYQDFHKHFSYFCDNGYDMNSFKNYGLKKKNEMQDIFKRIFPNADQIKKQCFKEKIYESIMQRKQLICTSCQQVMTNGLIAICLHPYCQECFKQEWIAQKKNSEKIKFQSKTIQRRYMNCVDHNCQQKIFNRQTLQIPRINRFNKKINEIQPNKKIKELIQEIKKTQPKEKVVVYTHFIGMIEILMYTFEQESINALNLIGKDSIQQRGEKIQAFKQNENIKVLVISTKCGYAGLNLQFANKIYFMQPWWNPAVQDQALGRLHRYGQQKEVQSTRFLIKDSIEETINLAGKQKRLLSDFVLDSDSLTKRKKKINILKEFKKQLTRKLNKQKNKKIILEENLNF